MASLHESVHALSQEHELKQLQAALQALGGEHQSNPVASSQQQQQHTDTGVFHSVNSEVSDSLFGCDAPTHVQPLRHQAGPNVTSHASNHTDSSPYDARIGSSAEESHAFQCPEKTPSPLDQGRPVAQQYRMTETNRHNAHQPPHTKASAEQLSRVMLQHKHLSGRAQAAQYTVQEPDSPCQTKTDSGSNRAPQPASARHPCTDSIRSHHGSYAGNTDLPGGCLYQDTTIRRTTTPLKDGKRNTAYAHEEYITVRQIREIRRSEAHNVSWMEHGQPHVTQGQLIKYT